MPRDERRRRTATYLKGLDGRPRPPSDGNMRCNAHTKATPPTDAGTGRYRRGDQITAERRSS